ncbi:hypothetical protein HK099_001968 [Clydaea vesicula]|uniref:Cytochrome P450 n=1 Tax=Clydaea vesicula TaxID=447962 RepID=A0AAD5U3B0_9FUNG|nr:hypothetical protein HK099_001968 [Clydaea vesicula]
MNESSMISFTKNLIQLIFNEKNKTYVKLSIISLTAVYIFSKVIFFTKEKWRLKDKNFPPALKGNFLTKNFFEARRYHMANKTHQFFSNLNKEHHIISFQIPFIINGVSVSKASLAKKIIYDPSRFNRADVLSEEALEGLTKKSLFMLKGDIHKKHRKMLQPGFSPSHLRIAFEASKECCGRLFKAFHEKKIETFNVYDYFKYISIDVIGKTIFSYDFELSKDLDVDTPKYDSLKQLENLNVAMQKRGLPRFLWWFFGVSVGQIRRMAKGINDTVSTVIEAKKRSLNNRDPSTIVGKWGMDVLDRLIENAWEIGKNNKEAPFTNEELRDEVLGFYFAGLGTTTDSLGLAILDILTNPRVQKKLVEEIDATYNKDGGFNHENFNAMTYIDYVVKECQRIHPIAFALVKIAMTDTELEGYFIKKDTPVFINLLSIQTNKEYWGEDALEFKPERWENGFIPVNGSYMPFSDGIMACIAQKLATVQMKVVLIEFFRKYDISLVPGQDLSLSVLNGRFGPEKGITISIKERNL